MSAPTLFPLPPVKLADHKAALERYARAKMDLHGLDEWTFKWNRRKKAFGTCFPVRGEIQLSAFLLEHYGEQVDWHDVVLHEIAHAVDYLERGTTDHSDQWKEVCREIGAKQDRCLDTGHLEPPKGRYSATCPGCGCVRYRHRKPKHEYSFGQCGGGHFNRRFALVWTDARESAAPYLAPEKPKGMEEADMAVRAARTLCRMMRSVYGDAVIDGVALANAAKPPKGHACASDKLGGPKSFQVLLDAWELITGAAPDFDAPQVRQAFDDAFVLARSAGYDAGKVDEFATL